MKKKLLSMAILLVILMALSGCSKAGDYYRDGKNNFDAGNYEKAVESFSMAITANPNRADYYIDYGMTLIKLEKYDEALTQLDLACLDKDLMIVKENNKRALRGKGIVYYNRKQYERAIEQFEAALKINELSGLDMDILYYMADSLKTIGSYDKAIKAYTDILAINHKSAVAYNCRAYCYKSIGDYKNSLADFESAIKIEPDNYDYYFGKYYLLTENGDEAVAAKVLKKAEAITTVTIEDVYKLAIIHFFQGNYEAALAELDKSYTNGFDEAYYYIGEVYRIRKDYEKAAYYYKIYIEGGKLSSSNVYNQIAACKLKTGDFEEALEYLELGLAYNYAGTLQIMKKNEIIIYENLGRYEEAKVKMDEYLASYPDDTEAEKEAGFIETRVNMPAAVGNNE